jgi:hypothetical protein
VLSPNRRVEVFFGAPVAPGEKRHLVTIDFLELRRILLTDRLLDLSSQ